MAKKINKKGKLNETIMKAYQTAILNRTKAGHDTSKMVSRLNDLILEHKK